MAFLPGEAVNGMVNEAARRLPTWTHDATGRTYQLPDDTVTELFVWRNDPNVSGTDFIRLLAERLLGPEAWAEVTSDPMRPMGQVRCQVLVDSWGDQIGLTSGKSLPPSEPSGTTDTTSNATSSSATESTPPVLSTAG